MEDEVQRNIERLKHENPEVRYWAVMYFEYKCDKATVPVLIEVLNGDDNDMRGVAAKALARIGPVRDCPAERQVVTIATTIRSSSWVARSAGSFELRSMCSQLVRCGGGQCSSVSTPSLYEA